jgi:hypothetical protein
MRWIGRARAVKTRAPAVVSQFDFQAMFVAGNAAMCQSTPDGSNT